MISKMEEEANSPLHHFSLMPLSPDLSSADRGLFLIHLLVNCATHVFARNFDAANAYLENVSVLASPDGDPMQRIASYFIDALASRLLRSLPGVYRALNLTRAAPDVSASLLSRRHFFDLLPFLKLSIILSNHAIAAAMDGEKIVHVIDLHAWDPSQWIALLHVLSSRPGGPPHLRLTGIHPIKSVLDATAARLADVAETLDVPFQFNPIVSTLSDLDLSSLPVKTGEAVAVSSLLQLHLLLAPSPKSPPKIDAFLASLRRLAPKILVVSEQETNHNQPGLNERFTEALNYYAAAFDCLESAAGRGAEVRGKVERMLGEEIKEVIACEGGERRARHERFERWGRRLEGVGFGPIGLGRDGLFQARLLLQQGFRCEGFKVREEAGCCMLCWQNHALFSVSAWKCRRFE